MLNNKVDESGEIVTVPHAPLVLAQVDVDLTARGGRFPRRPLLGFSVNRGNAFSPYGYVVRRVPSKV